MSNQSTITAFLQGKGLSPAAIAGVEGNLQIESGFDPTNNSGDGGTSWGIAQWHLSRQTALVNYANSVGTSWTNLNTQLNYLWNDLNTNYTGLLAQLKSPGITPAQAATDFSATYEVNAGGAAPRVAAANKIAGSSSSSSGGILNGALNVLSAPGNLIQGAAKSVVSPIEDTASAAVSTAKAVEGAAQWASDPHNWLRVAWVIGGSMAVLLGAYIAFKDTGAGKLATKGAALAAVA